MFKTLKLNDFRLFKEQTIILGKYITILAGRNSTGKSTILGLLGNSSELKKKQGTTYNGKQFRAEFSEIFKGSNTFDLPKSNRVEIILSDDNGNDIDYRKFRTAWQDNNERFRIIPSKDLEDGRKTEAKFDIPVLYLGLSRLFPIGESEEKNIKSTNVEFQSERERKWFVENYQNILSIYDDISDISNFSIGETDKKNGIGIATEKYDYLTNSAGQDNIGQILMAILSYRKLYELRKDSWNGGLLLIDEIDATLHPAAQKKLITLLIKTAKDLKIQVVITTHSSDLLKHITTKTTYNSTEKQNEVELYYFTNGNRKLDIKRNIDYSTMEGDLLVQSILQEKSKIKVYTEDEENRWFLKNLIKEFIPYVDILDVTIGCSSLLSLYKGDLSYFGNCIIVFDGDVKDKDINVLPENIYKNLNNIIKLPGEVRPEQVLSDYILNLPEDHPAWEKLDQIGMNWIYFKSNGVFSEKYKCDKDRDSYKKWFKDHIYLLDSIDIFSFWKIDNLQEVDQFNKMFKEKYNTIAKRTFARKIP